MKCAFTFKVELKAYDQNRYRYVGILIALLRYMKNIFSNYLFDKWMTLFHVPICCKGQPKVIIVNTNDSLTDPKHI